MSLLLFLAASGSNELGGGGGVVVEGWLNEQDNFRSTSMLPTAVNNLNIFVTSFKKKCALLIHIDKCK